MAKKTTPNGRLEWQENQQIVLETIVTAAGKPDRRLTS
jgi:hypothetical protein